MLEIKNLTKKFGTKTVIDDLSMTVKDNEIMAIVGPSGAGKQPFAMYYRFGTCQFRRIFLEWHEI